MIKSITKKFGEFLIVAILFGGVFYAVTTSWKNDERLTAIGSDIKSIKKSMVALLLDEKPDKSSIAKDLISDAKFLKGVESFKAGNYENAYSIWQASALKGNRDSIYAIAVATESLKQKLNNKSLPDPERKTIEMVLTNAPDIKEKNGVYFLRKAP